MGPGVGKQPRAPPAPIPPGSLHRRGSDAPSHIPQRVPSSPEPRAPILGLGGAVLTPVPFLPLQPTCTSARPCGRAAGCASRPTRASSAAGACRRSAARCGSTAWPPRAAGCTPAAATAAAPTPRSPRYAGTGWEWGQSSPVARQSGRGLAFVGPSPRFPLFLLRVDGGSGESRESGLLPALLLGPAVHHPPSLAALMALVQSDCEH